jgi:hypothetical protein
MTFPPYLGRTPSKSAEDRRKAVVLPAVDE